MIGSRIAAASGPNYQTPSDHTAPVVRSRQTGRLVTGHALRQAQVCTPGYASRAGIAELPGSGVTASVSIIAVGFPDGGWPIPRRRKTRYEIWKQNLLLGPVHLLFPLTTTLTVDKVKRLTVKSLNGNILGLTPAAHGLNLSQGIDPCGLCIARCEGRGFGCIASGVF